MEKYINIKFIGEGAFGNAILVQEKSTAKIFLMKTIDIRKIDKKSRLKTHNETNFLKLLSHSHIVKYRESFVHLKFTDQSVPLHNHAIRVQQRPSELPRLQSQPKDPSQVFS